MRNGGDDGGETLAFHFANLNSQKNKKAMASEVARAAKRQCHGNVSSQNAVKKPLWIIRRRIKTFEQSATSIVGKSN